ncbi:hypothetical protein [uncultured Flavobacterium sp.]|uniref:hypothetical protein n=1 Tax=uncultured Flavobacterium sp. TaxID=165435 RepID=UPI0027E00B86|nr:hypothetical protein [uncultured Flavobacterium sp.]
MSNYIVNAVAKVTFHRVLKNGTNSCWLKIKKASFSYTQRYWLAKPDFYYLKIYEKLENGTIGRQIGFITRSTSQFTP